MDKRLREWLLDVHAKEVLPVMPDEESEYLRFAAAAFNRPSVFDDPSVGSFADEVILSIATETSLILIESDVALTLRVAFLESCGALFEARFSALKPLSLREAYTHICFLFWDALLSYVGPSTPLRDDLRILRETVFQCLSQLLAMDNLECQRSALHGFNHLQDDRCRSLIDAFMSRCEDAELKAYAQRARDYQEL